MPIHVQPAARRQPAKPVDQRTLSQLLKRSEELQPEIAEARRKEELEARRKREEAIAWARGLARPY